MQIFISWSGERSRLIASALSLWLPKVIQAVKPWMSDTDIPSGKLWADKIRNGLLESNFGIICLTPENLINPWLLFEAGALSKFNESFVVPYVYDMKPSEIPFPLAMYQGETANEGGTRKLLDSIQLALGNLGLKQEILEEAFKTSWPTVWRQQSAEGVS